MRRERIAELLATAALAVACACALVVTPWTLMPFVTGKAWCLALAGTLAALSLWAGARLPRRLPWAVGVWLAASAGSAVASAATGCGVALSLWDSLERQLGLVSLAQLALVFAALFRIPARPALVNTWLAVGVASAAAAALTGLAQAFGAPLLPEAVRDGRAAGTLGHPTLLAGVCLYGASLSAALALRSSVSMSLRRAALAMGALCVAGLLAADTRSATLGGAIGLVLFVALRARTLGGAAARRLVVRASGLGAAVALAGALAVLAGLHVPGLSRVAELTRGATSLSTRRLVWHAALDSAAAAPVLGAGPGCFPVALDAHFPPALSMYGERETWWDEAHSVWLNALVERGLLGLALLLVAWGAITRMLLRRARADVPELAALCAGLGASAVHLTFALDGHSSIELQAVAVVVALGRRDATSSVGGEPTASRPRDALAALAFGSMAVLTLGALLASTLDVAALHEGKLSLRAAGRGVPETTLAHLSRGESLAPWRRDQLAAIVARAALARESHASDGARASDAALYGALGRLLAERAATPSNDSLARLDAIRLLRAEARALGRPLELEVPLALARDSAARAPTRQAVLFELGALELASGRRELGLAALVRARDLEPRLGGGWWRLALAHEQLGERDAALRVGHEARARASLSETDHQILRRMEARLGATGAAR